MLMLLRAEFEYYKLSVFFYLLVFLSVDTAFILWGTDELANSYPALRSVFILIIAALIIMRQVKLAQDKMDRFYMKLPISLNRTGILRLMFLTSFWTLLVLLFCLSFIMFAFSHIKITIFWDLLSLSGLVFAGISVPLIHRDLNMIFQRPNQKIIIAAIYVVFIIAAYLFMMFFFISTDAAEAFAGLKPYKEIISIISNDGMASLIVFLAGIALLYLSSIIFQKRKVYLD